MTIQIDPIPAETIQVPIIGTSPLIVHRFSEKAKKAMLDNMQGKKSPKLPMADTQIKEAWVAMLSDIETSMNEHRQ